MLMSLLYQTHSPFARKALVVAKECFIDSLIDVEHHETSPVVRNEEVYAANPLGKVPVLITDSGLTLYDSNVISAYFDALSSGPKLLPDDPVRRFTTLRLEALAQGICDAGIRYRTETERRPQGMCWQKYADGQADKLLASYEYLENSDDLDGPLNLGHIALGTALDWIVFRGLPGFESFPKLTDWYLTIIQRESFKQTQYSGQTYD